MADKPLVWVGSSLDELRRFPGEARRDAGYQLRRVQQGLPPADWRPLRSVGTGVLEIRVHAGAEYRVVYIAKFEEAVYVLNAFQKRTRRTRRPDIDLAKARLREVVKLRKRASRTS